ncbi:MAG TPA: hypothetical protein VFC84_01980 [Desulfosporosinus sp.]|nr:hypothetical protein [Desulfosporosinus sp.]
MKTQEELQRELSKQTSEVEDAMLKLRKAMVILEYWTDEYGFQDKPEPLQAVMYRETILPEKNIRAEQSCKWFYEYNRIYQFIDIVRDYVYESKELLGKALG